MRILTGVEVIVHGIRGKLGMWQYERGIMLSGSGWAVEWIIICECGRVTWVEKIMLRGSGLGVERIMMRVYGWRGGYNGSC